MARLSAPLAIFLLLGVAWAGCAGGTGGTPADLEPPLVAEFDEMHGGIVGTIIDVEGRPIEGAAVALLELGVNTKSREDGGFVLNQLEPDTYTLFVDAIGYQTVTRNLEVWANRATQTVVALMPLQIEEPYRWYGSKDGYWSCVVRLYVQNADCSVVTGDVYDGFFTFPVDANYSALFFELTWTPTSEFTKPSRASMSFYSFNSSTLPGGRPHGVNRSAPPITVLVEPGGAPMQPQWTDYPADMTQARVYLIPIGYLDPTPQEHGRYGLGLIYQQRYRVHASFFYHQDFPAGYTGIPDG